VCRHHCWAAGPLGLGLSLYIYCIPSIINTTVHSSTWYQRIRFRVFPPLLPLQPPAAPSHLVVGLLPQQPSALLQRPRPREFPPGGGSHPSRRPSPPPQIRPRRGHGGLELLSSPALAALSLTPLPNGDADAIVGVSLRSLTGQGRTRRCREQPLRRPARCRCQGSTQTPAPPRSPGHGRRRYGRRRGIRPPPRRASAPPTTRHAPRLPPPGEHLPQPPGPSAGQARWWSTAAAP
jgi:hypothetical protein